MSLKAFISDDECYKAIPKGIDINDSNYYVIADDDGSLTLCYDLEYSEEDETILN